MSLTKDNSTEFMEALDEFIDELADMTNPYENMIVIGSLTSMAYARVHFLPEDMRKIVIQGIENQLKQLKQLLPVINLDNDFKTKES